MQGPARPSASAQKPGHVRPSPIAAISHAPIDSWADISHSSVIADEHNMGFCTGAPQQDIADERDRGRPSSALADKRDFAEVAGAPQQGRSVRFEQEEGSGRELSSDDESRGGDTTASSTDNDIANGDLTAVAARRKEKAQPKRKVVGEVHHPKPSAYKNTKAEVGNVALMISNWGERSENQNLVLKTESARSSSYGKPGTDPSDIRSDNRRRKYARTAAAACRRQTAVATDWTCSCRQCGGARLLPASCHDRPGCKDPSSHGSAKEQLQRHRNPLL